MNTVWIGLEAIEVKNARPNRALKGTEIEIERMDAMIKHYSSEDQLSAMKQSRPLQAVAVGQEKHSRSQMNEADTVSSDSDRVESIENAPQLVSNLIEVVVMLVEVCVYI